MDAVVYVVVAVIFTATFSAWYFGGWPFENQISTSTEDLAAFYAETEIDRVADAAIDALHREAHRWVR